MNSSSASTAGAPDTQHSDPCLASPPRSRPSLQDVDLTGSSGIRLIVISFISIFYKGWIDNIYRQAAGSTLYTAVYFIISIITMFPLGIISGILSVWLIGTGTSRFAGRVRQGILPLRLVRRVAVLWIALGVPLMFIVNSAIYRAFQATATFDQRLMALAPVISDQERKSLLGQWAVMKGRADYDKINARFEELAEKYHAELPPPYI